MARVRRLRLARGDLFGGLTAAVIALPLALAFGVAAMSPLGPEHASTGALVGLLGAIFTGFFASCFGGTPAQITGPTGPMTAVITLFVASSMVGRTTADVPLIMTLTGLAIAVGGGIQIALGWVGGGKLVKYIPYPVIAGFMNGIAVIIVLGQVKPFLGVTGGFSDLDLASAWVPILIGTITIAAIGVTRRLSPAIPGALVGLLAGVAAYLVIALLGHAPLRADDNTLLIGAVPNPFTSFDHVPLLQLGSLGDVSLLDAKRVLSTGVTIAVLGSIDSLLTSVVADVVTGGRHDSKKELYGQGIGNAVAGLLGGLAGAGATVRTLVNLNAGGRTRHAGMIHAGAILVVVLALGYPAGWIPQATLAGILFVTAYGIIDRYSLGLFRRRLVRNEFVLMLAVAAVTVAVDLMLAVALGVGAAAFLFIVQQSKVGVAVRRLRGNELRSRRYRPEAHLAILGEQGAGTLIYRLRGALFFLTIDTVLSEVEADAAITERVILDVSGVRELDLSGIQFLLQLAGRFRERGTPVAISGLATMKAARPGLPKMLLELGVFEKVGKERVHDTLDRALEAFEDEVLAAHAQRVAPPPLELDAYEGLAQLSASQRTELSRRFVEREVAAGEVVFEASAAADALALVRRGRLALVAKHHDGEARLAVLGRGEIYGARVFLDGTHWLTELRAEEPSSVFLLPRAAIHDLRREHPELLERLQQGLLRTTMARLDALRSEVALLES
jgi:sulfate permease, SulP family